MTSDITADEHHLWIILHKTVEMLIKYEDSLYAQACISTEKYKLLMVLKFFKEIMGDELIIATLAPLLNRSTNSVSTIVERMEKEGLIRKVRDLEDKRSIRLVITSDGEKKLKMAAKPNMEIIKKVFSIYNKEELHTLIALIEKLKGKINNEMGKKEEKADLELSNNKKMTDFLVKLT